MTDQLKAIQRKVGVPDDGVYGPATEKAIAVALDCVIGTQAKVHTLSNTEAFFTGVRAITGGLNQTQVDVINDLLKRAAHWPIGWLAYGFATAWHEARLQPIEEYGKGKNQPYGVVDQTGKAPYGRGLVQLTWRSNYVNADTKLSLGGTLAGNYGRALEEDIAAQILVGGMEEGWFTGKSLKTYVSDSGTHGEFVNARRIINGTDKADMIAGYADKFKSALLSGGWA